VTALIQPVAGWFSDRLGRKPLIAISSLAAAASLYTLAAIGGKWQLLIVGVTLIGLAAMARPARDSMTAESVGRDKTAMAYSAMFFFVSASGIFAPTVGGFIAERWGYVTIFLISMALEGASLLLVIRLLKETSLTSQHPPVTSLHPQMHPVRALGLRACPERSEGLRPKAWVLARQWRELNGFWRKIILPPKELRGFYLATAADAFVWGLAGAIMFGLLRQTYGFTTCELGILSSLASTSWAV
jgi:MFS family permease